MVILITQWCCWNMIMSEIATHICKENILCWWVGWGRRLWKVQNVCWIKPNTIQCLHMKWLHKRNTGRTSICEYIYEFYAIAEIWLSASYNSHTKDKSFNSEATIGVRIALLSVKSNTHSLHKILSFSCQLMKYALSKNYDDAIPKCNGIVAGCWKSIY